MFVENTTKLLRLPNEGGFSWRLTKKRVVKDWLILAGRSEARS